MLLAELGPETADVDIDSARAAVVLCHAMIASRAPDPAQPGPPAWRRGLGVLALAVLVAVIAASDALHDPLARLLALTEGMIHDSPRLGPALFVLFAALSGILAFFSSAVIVPIAVHGKTFVVAAARPEDVAMREEVRVVTGLAIEVVHADGELVDRVRRAAYGRPS